MGPYPITVLSLFSGVAGLELGAHIVGGFQTVCYVESDAYAQGVLMSRMRDGGLDEAPIWDDIKTFDGKPWRGSVDVVCGGFPCPPVSVAGKRKGTADARWLWPEFIRIVREVRPGLVLVENVPGLLSANGGGAFGEVLRDLAKAGFDAEWNCVSAADVGAPQLRQRVWVVAYAQHPKRRPESQGRNEPDRHNAGWDKKASWAGERGEGVVHPTIPRLEGSGNGGGAWRLFPQPWPPSPDDVRAWAEVLAKCPEAQPAIRGMASRFSRRLDRLRCLGNAVVPQAAAAWAWPKIKERRN